MSDPESTPTDHPAPPKRTWSNLLIGLHLAAGVVFLLALNLLSLGASTDWALDLLTHFRFQYAAAFAVAGLGLALLKWKRMAGLALLGLLFNLWFVAPLFLPNADTRRAAQLRQDDTAPSLTVLHFNVHTANANKQGVAQMIRDSGADVVFLQEINHAWVAALDGEVDGYRPIKLDPRSDNFGIGLWVREETAAPEVLNTTLTDISDGLAQVNAIDVTLKLNTGPSVRLLSLHTLPPVSGTYAAARDAQLAEAARLAAHTDTPFILIGDLNATPWSAQYRALVQDGGLTDSLRGHGFDGLSTPGASWPAGMLSLGMIPIDHALTRNGAVVTQRTLGDAHGSDHRPLLIEVKLDRSE